MKMLRRTFQDDTLYRVLGLILMHTIVGLLYFAVVVLASGDVVFCTYSTLLEKIL